MLPAVAPPVRSAERGVGTAVWRRMKPILLAHIQRNMRENEGFFFIEDGTRRNSFMGQPKRVFRKQVLRPGRSTYIVRVLFEEQAFEDPGAKSKGKSGFLVDFTLSSADGRRWAVKDQAVYAYNKQLFFKYDEGYRRVPATDKDGVLTITIESDEPEADEALERGGPKKGGPPGAPPQPVPGGGWTVPQTQPAEGESPEAAGPQESEEGGTQGFNPGGPDTRVGPSSHRP